MTQKIATPTPSVVRNPTPTKTTDSLRLQRRNLGCNSTAALLRTDKHF